MSKRKANRHSAEISIKKITQRIIECLEGESYIHARAALKAAEGKLEQHTLVTKVSARESYSDIRHNATVRILYASKGRKITLKVAKEI